MKPHKHAELIKAWADGAKIQIASQVTFKWMDLEEPVIWHESHKYRIKPEPKPDVVGYGYLTEEVYEGGFYLFADRSINSNFKAIFDCETRKLKGVELL